MDFVNVQERLREGLRKYRGVLIVVLAGIFLMALPGKKPPAAPAPVTAPEPDLAEALSELLSRVEGAGRVRVMLTVGRGEEILYQCDEDSVRTEKSDDLRRKTVVLGGSQHQEGLVRQINPPSYLGAVVLCQGADSARVRLAIVEAVSKAAGIGSDRITVLKMK